MAYYGSHQYDEALVYFKKAAEFKEVKDEIGADLFFRYFSEKKKSDTKSIWNKIIELFSPS